MKYKTIFGLKLVFILLSNIAFGQKKNVAHILSCSISPDTVINWTAKEDTVKFIYLVQQFKWNRWVTWDTIQSLNQKDSTKYSCKISKYIHSGQNQFRINAVNMTPKLIVSRTIIFKNKEYDAFKLQGHFPYYQKNPITFTVNTYYELYDKNGIKLKSGYGNSFYIKDLPKDIYYLNYDNKTTEIIP